MEIKIPIVFDEEALQKAIDKRVAELKQEGDFVIVTRCKDCKYWKKRKDYESYCNHWESMLTETKEDDFCSYAEPKEIEGDNNG